MTCPVACTVSLFGSVDARRNVNICIDRSRPTALVFYCWPLRFGLHRLFLSMIILHTL